MVSKKSGHENIEITMDIYSAVTERMKDSIA